LKGISSPSFLEDQTSGGEKKIPSRESRDFTSTSGNSVVLPGTKRWDLRSFHRLVKEILMAISYIFPIQSTNFANLSKGQVVD